MAVISEVKVTGPILNVTFENGLTLSTEHHDRPLSDLLGKDLNQIKDECFALEWLHIQYEAAQQGVKLLDFFGKTYAPATQTTSYIGQFCATTQTSLDRAITDVCQIDIPLDIPEAALKTLRLGRGRFLRLKLIGQWQSNQISYFLSTLKGLPIDCVELPIGTYDKSFQRQSLIPLAIRPEAHRVEEVFSTKPTNRLHLDPVLLGGVAKTYDVATRAKALFLDPIISSPPLSAISMLACVNLARSIDLQGHFTHDLDRIIDVEGIPTLQIQAGWLID